LPPLVIKLHGGPTSNYSANYDSETQFFTSRGYAVLALNYRGSTGYGQAYRQALSGKWGVHDVEDTHSAAAHLVKAKKVDPRRIILVGGSAGAFTAYLSLIRFPGFFQAAICRYGVTDLFELVKETHRFEAHYLDSLIGILPSDEAVFRSRSPALQADQIVDPVAIFQGSDDRVVPPAQSEAIVRSLKSRGVPYLYRLYEGEGHGWKKEDTILDYYHAVESFLNGLNR
jgi:dipeptidyl aminopeptidase/acylaminoacyl peptidase